MGNDGELGELLHHLTPGETAEIDRLLTSGPEQCTYRVNWDESDDVDDTELGTVIRWPDDNWGN
jgi:hypothetical protein